MPRDIRSDFVVAENLDTATVKAKLLFDTLTCHKNRTGCASWIGEARIIRWVPDAMMLNAKGKKRVS